jgi:hypothetical protein
MAAKRTYSEEQREAIFLLMRQGRTATSVADELDRIGYPPLGIEPFYIPRQTVGRLYREVQRAAESLDVSRLANLDARAGVLTLLQRVIILAEREIDRLAGKQAKGRLDVREIERATAAIDKLERLASRTHGQRAPAIDHDETEPETGSAFIESLRDDDTETSSTPASLERESTPSRAGDQRGPARPPA